MTQILTSVSDSERRSELARQRVAKRKYHTVACLECDLVMHRVYNTKKFCSNRCKLRWHRRRRKEQVASYTGR